jgi:hypothetical protein
MESKRFTGISRRCRLVTGPVRLLETGPLPYVLGDLQERGKAERT